MEWRQALYHLEENPPSHCWKEVNDRLDQEIPELRNLLYTYSELAPEESKPIIFNRLSKQKAAIFQIKRSKAVAVASIAVILSLTILYTISTPDNKPKVGTSVIQVMDTNQSKSKQHNLYTNSIGYSIKLSPKLKTILTNHSVSNDSLVQKWQEKLITSPYIPSPNNFFDIAEMVKLLEENDKN